MNIATIVRNLEPELPQHLYDEEYDLVMSAPLQGFLKNPTVPAQSVEDFETALRMLAGYRVHTTGIGHAHARRFQSMFRDFPLSRFIEAFESREDRYFTDEDRHMLTGILNELYAQLAALASRRAAERIPELGYWD